MFGIIGTVGVVAQMAMLAAQLDTRLAMAVGLVSASCWVMHAISKRDQALFVTNIVVAGFAAWGIS
jgi:hypothetical protein